VLRVWEDVDRQATIVYAASVALDCPAAMEGLEPETALDSQVTEARGASARLTLRLDDPNFAFFFVRREPSDSFFISGVSPAVQLTNHTAARIEGRFHSGPEPVADVATEVDLRFAAPIAAGAVTGEPLPPGGGEPGRAYLDYVAALGRKDFGAIQRLTVGRAASRALSGGFDAFRQREPRSAQVLGGELRGTGRDVAHLRLRATTFDGESILTRVRMERDENGAWRLRDRGATILQP
jgi:hypothetical protein